MALSRYQLLDLQSLEIFLAVCETRSMTAAGHRLGLSQSAISYRVSALEELVGDRLVDRQFRPMTLTPAGEVLRDAALSIGGKIQILQSALDNVRTGRLSHMRLGLPGSLSGAFAPALARTLLGEVERVTIRSGNAADLMKSLKLGDIDFAIVTDIKDPDLSVITQPILREPYVLALPSDHPPVESVEELRSLAKHLPLVRWLSGQFAKDIELHFRRIRLEAPERFEVESRLSVLNMVKAGLGWTVLTPLTAFDVWSAGERVKIQPFPGAKFQRRLLGGYHKGRFQRIGESCVCRSREILRTEYLPLMLSRAPWLSGSLTVHGDDDPLD